ncbi:MAG: O-acetylhomoserine aminocarboxypropyltransferase/cysteine synthase family protein [Candidatus Saliniplasma sp.]
MSDDKYNFDTHSIHSEDHDDDSVSCTTPIHSTASYLFKDTEEAADLFSLEKTGDIYSRISNPTTRVFEDRITNLEGGVGAVATSSGMAAINLIISSLADKGDNIVSSSKLYGGTFTLFTQRLPEYGIEVRMADKEKDIVNKIDEDTKCIHFETIGNPSLEVPDFERISQIAHENGLPLVVDNTFATPYLCKPIEHGADIVWHSTTKWINGHGNAIGGIVIDSGNFDWKKAKFEQFYKEDDSYHGLSFYEQFKERAFIEYCRCKGLRDFGACPSPFNSFLNLIGLETLSLRMDKHCSNAEKLARFLKGHEKVNWVSYPGLEDHTFHSTASRYLKNGYGAVLTFGLDGGYKAGKKLIEEVELISFSANLGDTKSLIIHPSSTIHRQLNEEEKKRSGVTDDLIRFSVGIEDPIDIKKDLKRALNKI